MIDEFRQKLRVDNHSLKWFVDKYLPDRNYSTISLQVNGFSAVQDYTEEAIILYLAE